MRIISRPSDRAWIILAAISAGLAAYALWITVPWYETLLYFLVAGLVGAAVEG